MAVTATVDSRIRPERFDEFKQVLGDTLGATRAYDGCRSVLTLVDQDVPGRILLYEEWDSRDHQQKYIAWRMETGLMEALAPFVSEPPAISLYDSTDI
jgi:quinol monooxygenase YgiN